MTAPLLPDPCVERHQAGRLLRGDDDGALDVFLSGTVFMDMIFSGLDRLPDPGTEEFAAGLGSAPGGSANLAVALSRLGLRVGLAAPFSDDMFGSYLWRTLAEQEKIDLATSRHVRRWPTPVTVSLASRLDRGMITYGQPAPIEGDLVTVAPPAATCMIDLVGEPPAWALALRAAGTTIFADIGWDSTGEWSPCVLDRLRIVDVFLPNAVEAMSYTRTERPEDALSALGDRVPVCVVKKGGAGAIAVDNTTGECAQAPAIPVQVLDPTGAGDVFDAGFLFGTLAGWPLVDRLKFANLCGGLSVRHYSGSLGAPCWGEIAAWGEDTSVPEEILAEYGFLVPYIPDEAIDDTIRAQPTMGYGSQVSEGA